MHQETKFQQCQSILHNSESYFAEISRGNECCSTQSSSSGETEENWWFQPSTEPLSMLQANVIKFDDCDVIWSNKSVNNGEWNVIPSTCLVKVEGSYLFMKEQKVRKETF